MFLRVPSARLSDAIKSKLTFSESIATFLLIIINIILIFQKRRYIIK